jgi:hypothetical protein
MHPCCQLGPETADFHESNENLVKETFKCYEKYLPGRIFKPFKVFKSTVQSKAKKLKQPSEVCKKVFISFCNRRLERGFCM